MSLTIRQLIDRSYCLAKEKGWHDRPREIEESLLLIHSEVSEALEEIRAGRDPKEIYLEMSNMDGDWEEPFAPNKLISYQQPGGKPCGFPIELADVLIRAFDLAGEQGISFKNAHWLQNGLTLHQFRGMIKFISDSTLPERLFHLHAVISGYAGYEYGLEVVIGSVIAGVLRIAKTYNIDIEKAIEIKHAYNMTRPYRHGKAL